FGRAVVRVVVVRYGPGLRSLDDVVPLGIESLEGDGEELLGEHAAHPVELLAVPEEGFALLQFLDVWAAPAVEVGFLIGTLAVPADAPNRQVHLLGLAVELRVGARVRLDPRNHCRRPSGGRT